MSMFPSANDNFNFPSPQQLAAMSMAQLEAMLAFKHLMSRQNMIDLANAFDRAADKLEAEADELAAYVSGRGKPQ